MEVARAVALEADDLPVEDGMVGLQGVSELLSELRPLFEYMAPAGNERASMTGDDRESPEAVVLELEEPIARVERLGNTNEWLGAPRQHKPI
jgi:hypothetical protein